MFLWLCISGSRGPGPGLALPAPPFHLLLLAASAAPAPRRLDCLIRNGHNQLLSHAFSVNIGALL